MFFVGRTEMDVQGVYLRQLIKETADHKDFQIQSQESKGRGRGVRKGDKES